MVRFRGFGSADSASHAAAVAQRAMTRRLARGRRRRAADRLNGSANARAVGSVLRSFAEPSGSAGAGDFAFEVRVPPPTDELRMRGMAYVMYRAVRSSGTEWPLLRRAPPAPSSRRVA
jgi:hypothetical protein